MSVRSKETKMEISSEFSVSYWTETATSYLGISLVVQQNLRKKKWEQLF